MKLIFAIVSSDDCASVMAALVKERFSVTKLATSGGFLKVGNATLLIGTEATKVEQVLKIIEAHSKSRKEIVPIIGPSEIGIYSAQTMEVPVGGATVFVIDVESFIKM